MFEFKPLPSQPYDDVMFFNPRACADHLFETAQQRMHAVLDLVQMIEQSESPGMVRREAARLSFVIGLLLDDARSLYEAAHERAMELQRQGSSA
ncbi:hypothetical protein ACFPU0_07070 [Pseudomonas sp. GCM10022186]|uniref:hypothetical protein n=1 Tax=Pseudomonas sp. GCM10022186 TaxID=3252650 RepID=UPI00360A79D4